MSKGGSGKLPPQEMTTITSNLPDYAEPYFRQAMERTLYETMKPYETYAGSRLMDFTPQEQAAMQGMSQMAQSGAPLQFRQASDIASGIGYQPMGQGFDVASQYSPGTMADAETLQGYMDPYQQMVTDIEKREAARRSDIMGSQIGQQAAQTGGMGGYREAIMQAERERNLGQQLGDIQAKGSQRAFSQAQQAFQADRAARLQAAELGLRGLGVDQATERQRLQASQLLAGLGDQSQSQAYERLRNMQAAGEMQRMLGQQGLTMGYEDFLRQQAFPREQLAMLNNMLRELPVQPGTTTTCFVLPGS